MGGGSLKITKVEGTRERSILTAMIVSTPTLARIVGRWDKGGMFRSRWSNIIGQWCVDHYRKYEKAPGRAIEGLFHKWSEQANDKTTSGLVESYLQSISNEYARAKKINVDYTVDAAAELFNRTRVLALADLIQADAGRGEIDKALGRVGKFQAVTLNDDSWIDFFHNERSISAAITKKKEPPIITYDNKHLAGLNTFFGRTLRRGVFCCLKGIDKSGKSYWLLDFAWRAIKLKLKVAYFQIGDMSREQITARFVTRAIRRPLLSGVVQYPTFIESTNGNSKDDNQVNVTCEKRVFKHDVNEAFALSALRKFSHVIGDRKELPLLKLCTKPNGTMSAQGIGTELENLKRKYNWTPDVTIIDYIDVMAPPHGILDHRLQVDYNFQTLLALAQTTDSLVLTACQGNAAAYKANVMDRSHFSGSKTQNAHVDAMLAINVNAIDRERQVTRLNWIVNRDQAVNETAVCHVAGCISLANPAILSCY